MENKLFSQMNIETLMPSNNHNYNRNKGKIDINMISDGAKINIEPDRDFDANKLLDNIYERRRKKRNWLVDMYNKCCGKIKDADDSGLTDIIFTLPDLILEHSSYKQYEAIEYISKNLREQKLDTYIIDDKNIFITWKFYELHLDTSS